MRPDTTLPTFRSPVDPNGYIQITDFTKAYVYTSMRPNWLHRTNFNKLFTHGQQKNKLKTSNEKNEKNGAPRRTRTCSLRLRRPLLCPVELEAHCKTGWRGRVRTYDMRINSPPFCH